MVAVLERLEKKLAEGGLAVAVASAATVAELVHPVGQAPALSAPSGGAAVRRSSVPPPPARRPEVHTAP